VEQILPAGKLDALWASRYGGYWRLADGRVQKWKGNRLERDWGPYSWNPLVTPVTATCEDREGNLVVGTLGAGVFWFNAEGRATVLSTEHGLASNYILSLLVDQEGALWVGTDGSGLNRVKRQVFAVLEECRGWVVQSVCEDDQGGLWIGSNGGEVGFWKDGVLQRFGPGQGLPNPSVKAVLADRHGQVWVGTYAPGGTGLFRWQNDRFQRVAVAGGAPQVVQALHEDKQGQLWVGTDGGLMRWDEREWKIFTMRDGLSSDVVRALANDREGNLWIGTVGGGLNRWRDGQFTTYRKKDGLPSDDISSLWVDDAGVLWVGTVGSGLATLYDGKWIRYTTREGLISNAIGYLMDDAQGDLWIGSNVGLMRLSKKTLSDFARGLTNFVPCRAYGKSDGLPKAECTAGSQPAGCRARDGTLWFPTIKGLVSVNPAHLQSNTNPPPVVIESVLIEGEAEETSRLRANFSAGVTVPADKERVEIHYTSLSLAAPERARFKYRLEAHETAWIEAGNIRVARYSKLPPGHYRFHVTACNEDGVWNEKGSSLALTVEPPFWRTWWFITATVVVLLGMITAVVHYLSTQRLQRQLEHLRQQEALEKERARIARDIHDQVGASLTQVSLLGELVESDKDSPDEVEAHARQIAQTARETTRALDEIVWTVNPSNDTLDGLINYVCKYAQEYLAVAGLRYRLDVPAQLPSAPVSPEVRHNVFLAAKEAVTNVVRHAQASEVWVRLKLDTTVFTLEIEDNGRGVANLDQARAQSRNGLRNMSKRMEDIGGLFDLGPAPGGGSRVRLTVPMARG
jgi:signal transduction histidine kinase